MILKWLVLLSYFLKELILSGVKVAWLAVQPQLRLQPAIIAYPLTLVTDVQITLLANMITLTPGTLSVDVSADRKTLFIHALDVPSRERLIGDIAGGFETRILEATR
jgi:multicomponent Na+:H+ antiporter subunit E